MNLLSISLTELAYIIAEEINTKHLYYDDGRQCPVMYSGIRTDVAFTLGIPPNNTKYNAAFDMLKVEINLIGLMWVIVPASNLA